MLVFYDWKQAFWLVFAKTGSINSATGNQGGKLKIKNKNKNKNIYFSSNHYMIKLYMRKYTEKNAPPAICVFLG